MPAKPGIPYCYRSVIYPMADHDHTFVGMAAVFLTPTLSDGSVPLMRILAFCLLSALILLRRTQQMRSELIFLILLDAVRADAVARMVTTNRRPQCDSLRRTGALYAHVRQRADSPFNGELFQRAERLRHGAQTAKTKLPGWPYAGPSPS